MGRLEDIVTRNKYPRRHARATLTISIGLAIFVLVVLVLMVFTDLDDAPQTESAPPPKDDRVRGIELRRSSTPRDAAAD